MNTQQNSLFERKYQDGQRVLLLGEWEGKIMSFDAELGYYTALCNYCLKEHILFERDIAPIEGEKEATHATE